MGTSEVREPYTSESECERSISTMTRLNNYMSVPWTSSEFSLFTLIQELIYRNRKEKKEKLTSLHIQWALI